MKVLLSKPIVSFLFTTAVVSVNAFTISTTYRKNGLNNNQLVVQHNGHSILRQSHNPLSPSALYSSTSSSSSTSITKSPISLENIRNKNILVIGGSGRVGGSVVCNLLSNGAKVTVGGTNIQSFESSKQRWMDLYPDTIGSLLQKQQQQQNNILSFVQVDRESSSSISTSILSNQNQNPNPKYDLIIHTAGPFQNKVNTPNGIIDAAIQHSIPYIDVCDDYCTAKAIQTKYHSKAIEKNVPCILSTGCWPGVSSLMAKQLVNQIQTKYPKVKKEQIKVDFSFFTAGSGGAGMTILLATFLILAEKSLIIQNNRRREIQAMKEYTNINFGPIVGNRNIAHLNLLEAASIHDILGVGYVQTLFGTAPEFWNVLLGVMAQLPSELLGNEELMKKLALFSLPIVRVVDYFAGATNAMRCDVSYVPSKGDGDDEEGEKKMGEEIKEMALYAHENLEPCVGQCVVGFCAAILASSSSSSSSSSIVNPGVYFPEEAIHAGEDIANVLKIASIGAHTLEVESNSGLKKEDVWGVI